MPEVTREMGLTPKSDQSPSEFQVTDQDIEHLESLSLSDDATAETGHDGDERAVMRLNIGKLTPEPDKRLSGSQVTDQDSNDSLEAVPLACDTETGTDEESEGPISPTLSFPGYDEKILSMDGRPTPSHNNNSDLDDLLESAKSTLDKANINKALDKVSTLLNLSQDNKAEKETLQALEKAKNLNLEETFIAKIKHWLGRIAYFRHKDVEAYRYFLEARPCLNDRSCTEARQLPVYLSLFGQGVTEKDREEILAQHVKTVTSHHGRRPYPASTPMKRKRELDSSRSFTPKTKPGDSRPVDDAEDWPVSTSTPPTRSALGWDHHKFTLRVYPTGLAPRTRKTKIIRKQPWEKGTMMSAKQWEIVKQKSKNVPMTMNVLAEERKRFLPVVRQIYFPAT
jgi:hypothetical protein